jgi:hypothetical protein
MSDAESYLRELRRALPLGYRRRVVAEVREHFASAIAAEAEHGVGTEEAERLTVERLGPARDLADQLLVDLRSGALGPTARLSAVLTTTRVIVAAALVVIAIAGAAVAVTRSSPATHSTTPAVNRLPGSPVVHNGVTVRRLVLTLQRAVQGKANKRYWSTQPAGVITLHAFQGPRLHVWYARPAGVPPARLTVTRAR